MTEEEIKALQEEVERLKKELAEAKSESDEDKINKAVDDRLKEIKSKLDKAYGERDKALDKVKELENENREREIEALKAKGQFEEAHKKELEQRDERIKSLEGERTQLTRDLQLNKALEGLDQNFKSGAAMKMAFSALQSELVKDEDGNWVHKSGKSLKEAVKDYAGSDENAFLFEKKKSSGSGSPSNKKPGNKNDKKDGKFGGKSTKELLDAVKEGSLRRNKKR